MDLHQPNFPILIPVSDNLILKSVQVSDAVNFFKTIRENKNHFAAFDFISPSFESLKEVEGVIASLIKYKNTGSGVNYGLWKQDELLGLFTVNKVLWEKKEADVGFRLIKTATGHGFAKLGLEALCGDLINLGFRRLTASTAISNQRSQALLHKAGFEKIEILREHITVRGQKIDEFLYEFSGAF